MILETLALTTSLSSALSSILIAKGMKGASPTIAAFYSILAQTIILSALILTRTLTLNIIAVILFAVGGLFSSGIGRLFYFISINKIGVARSSAIIGSSPVFTVILSILLLVEHPTILGATAVTIGIILASGAREFKIEKALAIALAATLSYTLSNIISKAGLQIEPDPYLSAQVGATVSLIFFLVYIISTNQRNSIKVPKTSLLYLIVT